MLQKLIQKKLIKSLQQIEYGELRITTPEGEQWHFAGNKPGYCATATINDWSTISNMARKSDIGMAEDYRDGRWYTPDLVALLSFAMQNAEKLQHYLNGNWLYKKLGNLLYWTRRNNIAGSKKNIYHHYDIGNDFYRLWLDDSMTYSSALFSQSTDSLQQAQYNKYDRILDKLTQPGDILEVGCGWGGFAERALARQYKNFKGITLSKSQQHYAQQRLPKTATIALEDYRHQQGAYDYIVSIEMLEAVGRKYWPVYFKKLKSLLKPGGKIVIQTIVIADDLFARYSKQADMIRTFIFPGGMLPSIAQLKSIIQQTQLQCKEVHHFGEDYAKTLQHWLDNFRQQSDRLLSMGFDQAFQRLWEFYLASCIVTFRYQRTNVAQLEIVHA